MFCPECGTTLNPSTQQYSQQPEPHVKEKKPIYKKWWFWVILAVALFIIIGALGSEGKPDSKTPDSIASANPEPTKRAEETPAPSSTPAIPWYESGMYKVGTDIDAGEYFILSSGACYLEVTSDSSGTLESIVTNDNVYTFTFITIQDGQYLSISDGKFVKAEFAEVPGPENGMYSEGKYRVGFDIPSGEYKVEALSGQMAYIEVTSDSSGNLNSIISNDNFEGSKYISVTAGQYLTIRSGVIYANE